MTEMNWDEFWDNSPYTEETYVGDFPTEEVIEAVEKELGYKLPAFYIEMMRYQNGGTPTNTHFPTEESTSWAEDHVAITGIFGIGHKKENSLCGEGGSRFWIEEWEYPDYGIYICDCPSAGHDMVMLDYRKNGRNGEPEVVHVDQEYDYKITFLAPNFEAFVKGLLPDDAFEDDWED